MKDVSIEKVIGELLRPRQPARQRWIHGYAMAWAVGWVYVFLSILSKKPVSLFPIGFLLLLLNHWVKRGALTAAWSLAALFGIWTAANIIMSMPLSIPQWVGAGLLVGIWLYFLRSALALRELHQSPQEKTFIVPKIFWTSWWMIPAYLLFAFFVARSSKL